MKSPVLFLFVLTAFSASHGFSQPAPSKPLSESLEQAFKLIAAGEFKQAKAELEKATALAAGPCGECLLGMSHIYASEKKWDQAVEAVQQALPLLSSSELQARAYNQLAVAHVSLGDLAKAEEALRRAAALGGSWGAVARYNLAEVLARQQKWADVVETARLYLQEAAAESATRKEARVLLCYARDRTPDGAPISAESESAEPRKLEGGIRRPEVLFQVKPVYTAEARRALATGTVIVEAVIDEEGCVRKVKALKEEPNGLTESAMRSVRKWVFLPAMLEDRPVKIYYVLTVNYQVGR